MPSSITEICNLALMRVANRFQISNIDERSNEARACRAAYDIARRSTLRKHNWNFATAYKTPASATSPNPLYQYAFPVPSDSLRVRRIVPDSFTSTPIPYRIVLNGNSNASIILCNREIITVEYTVDVTDPNVFDASFVDGFAWRLAAEVALPLTGDRELQKDCLKGWSNFLPDAMAIDANEDQSEEQPEASWIAARGGFPSSSSWG